MSRTRKTATTLASLALALVTLASPARAQEPTTALPAGVKGEMLRWIQDAEGKLIELAAAIPEAKYSWRPSKDARTTAQVFAHVAGANFGIPSFFGVKPPAGYDFATYEKSLSKKADIEKALKDSFAHMKKALLDASEADLEKTGEMFGMKSSMRGGYMLLLAHAHEHLGQSIAYARSNKIAPPWTARMNARMEAMKKEGADKKAPAGHAH